MREQQKEQALVRLAQLRQQDAIIHEEIYELIAALSSYDLDGNLIATYAEIGRAMGISRQAAWERHNRGYWRRQLLASD